MLAECWQLFFFITLQGFKGEDCGYCPPGIPGLKGNEGERGYPGKWLRLLPCNKEWPLGHF